MTPPGKRVVRLEMSNDSQNGNGKLRGRGPDLVERESRRLGARLMAQAHARSMDGCQFYSVEFWFVCVMRVIRPLHLHWHLQRLA